LAYVSLRTPSELSNLFSDKPSSYQENAQKRMNAVIEDLIARPEIIECKFLNLSLYDSVGRWFMGALQKPQDRELKVSFSAHNFITLAEGEDWNELSLWKFAKATDIFLNKSRSMSSMIDLYNIYKSKGQGFYISDDIRPDFTVLAPGEGSELIRETKLKTNYHATPIRVNGEIAFMPVKRLADFAPIYKPIRHIGYLQINR
jgi:WD40 repeat protein